MSYFAYSLFSGSGGNCFLVCDESTKILVDAGVSEKKIACALNEIGTSLDEISAIFVTHEHTDHIKGLEMIEKHRPIPVHMTEGTARAFIFDPRSPIFPNLFAHRGNFSVSIGKFTVSSFSVPHDAADPVGYIIEKDGVRVGFATDAGYVTDEMTESLVGCRAAVIESNHDERALMLGPYPYVLKERIMSKSGHLSNSDAAYLAKRLAEGGAKAILLAHLSKENNAPSLALAEVKEAVGSGVSVGVCEPDAVVELKIL